MSNDKPNNVDEYCAWLRKTHGVQISSTLKSYYKTTALRIKEDFQGSEFWTQLTHNLQEFHDQYLIATGYPLLFSKDTKPTLVTKPYESIFHKTYRKNVLANPNWPQEPAGGWVLPINWFTRINDIVRTLIEVKYLDGVEFLIQSIKQLSQGHRTECKSFLEAREDGYYAAHLYVTQNFEIPRINWDTETVSVSIEIQITTQLQEVIRKLLHNYYENARQKTKDRDADLK